MLSHDPGSLWSVTIWSGIPDEGNLNFQRPLVGNLPPEVDSELNKRFAIQNTFLSPAFAYSAINECLQ